MPKSKNKRKNGKRGGLNRAKYMNTPKQVEPMTHERLEQFLKSIYG